MRGVDVRRHGSKNIGATNVARVLGKRLGLLCFFLDFLKGALPVAVSGIMTHTLGTPVLHMQPTDLWLWLAVAMAAVLGHMFSIFLMMRGGKGVATGFGAMVAMWPVLTLPALAALVVWFAVLKTARIMSVASMCGALAVPIGFVLTLIPPSAENILPRLERGLPALLATTALAALVIWRHRANIARLMRCEEPRIGGNR
jgi:glycerol-3-phosphate acyltransferase PlsY